jgi:hypothetical protein
MNGLPSLGSFPAGCTTTCSAKRGFSSSLTATCAASRTTRLFSRPRPPSRGGASDFAGLLAEKADGQRGLGWSRLTVRRSGPGWWEMIPREAREALVA